MVLFPAPAGPSIATTIRFCIGINQSIAIQFEHEFEKQFDDALPCSVLVCRRRGRGPSKETDRSQEVRGSNYDPQACTESEAEVGGSSESDERSLHGQGRWTNEQRFSSASPEVSRS